MAKKIEWVWIDAGGVLFPDGMRETGAYDRLATGLQKQGMYFDERKVASALKEAVDSYAPSITRAFVWQLTRPNRALYDRVLRGLQEDLAKSQIRAICPLRGEAVGVIRQLAARYRLAAYSSFGAEWLHGELERHRLHETFTILGVPGRHLVSRVREALSGNTPRPFVFTGADAASYANPDTRFFECALLATGVEPEVCAVVADRMDCDVVPARTLGMRTVLMRVGDHSEQHPRYPEEAPDVIVQSLSQLSDALDSLGR